MAENYTVSGMSDKKRRQLSQVHFHTLVDYRYPLNLIDGVRPPTAKI